MLLRISEFLLRFLDTSQGLVETFHGSLTKTLHLTAAVKDNHIEDLCLLHLFLVFYFFHNLKYLLVIYTIHAHCIGNNNFMFITSRMREGFQPPDILIRQLNIAAAPVIGQ